MAEPTYNSADQASVDNAAKEAVRRESEDKATFGVWMNHPKGRDLLYRLVYEICHLGQPFFAADDQGRSDTHRTYLALGERNIGAYIDNRLRQHPELYMKMLQEQQFEAEVRRSRLQKQNDKEDLSDGGSKPAD